MRADQLDYVLPDRLIATRPAEPRDAARLMVVHRDTGRVEHRHVRDLPDLGIVEPGDLLVANRTRVLPAAFEGVRERTGGKVGGLYLRSLDAQTWQVMLESRGRLQPGERIVLAEAGEREREPAVLELTESVGGGQWQVRCLGDEPVEALLGRVGHTPLPPYIQRARKARDEAAQSGDDPTRYNTVFADVPGSVAAPTAGLHFTDALLARLDAVGVRRTTLTLHVGPGTFMPIRSETLDEHEMHEEWINVPAAALDALRHTRQAGRRTLVVGTTSVRALESLPEQWDAIDGDFTTNTRLFIRPDAGFRFRFTDRLMTNFHLPRSTLLAMVAALPGVGLDRLMQWYAEAIDREYRFYSYGDAMLIV
ncbi:MAG: tRNA preQ1(34) S-adenosylmethionine ribosyltransferase-isomerase QueA [Phycisphaeraceae bacterium]